jgi:hypothetical protein
MSYFKNPRETWTVDECEKMAKHIERDGMGTPYPFKGACPWVREGKIRYNGGTVRNEEFYEGESFELPKLAKGFQWVRVPTWCFQIVKEKA